jgi:hypothetical protein
MAVAAEQTNTIDPLLALEMQAIEAQVLAEWQTDYQFVDDIPEVAAAREQERVEAEDILATRRRLQAIGEVAVQAPVDALSTAHKVIRAEVDHGEESDIYTELRDGLRLDCQRLVAEWYRKNKAEYFPASRHTFDETTEEFFSHGLSIRQMTENALMPISNNTEEEARRINERVEDATPQIMRGIGAVAIGEQSIRTISECSDTAIEAYQRDQREGNKHQGYFGYVPEIQKVMIRDIRLDVDSNDRFEEQVGLPGTYITHEIIQMALEEKGVSAAHMDKTELHGSQLLVSDDLMEFVEHLDNVASEQWCTNIFMGEEVAKDAIKDYAAFRAEALERQSSLLSLSEKVAHFVLHLATEGADRKEALVLVEDFVKILLLELGKKDAVAAEQMFDAKTASGLQEVLALEAAGRFEEAEVRMQEVERDAPGGGFCGAGTCEGLERVRLAGKELDELKKDLKAEAGDTLTKDVVRQCPKCGMRGDIYYAHKASGPVKKVCWSKKCKGQES